MKRVKGKQEGVSVRSEDRGRNRGEGEEGQTCDDGHLEMISYRGHTIGLQPRHVLKVVEDHKDLDMSSPSDLESSGAARDDDGRQVMGGRGRGVESVATRRGSGGRRGVAHVGALDVSFSGIETKTHRPPPAGSDTAWADDDPVLAGLPVPSLSLLLRTGCLNVASCDCTDALRVSRMWVSVLSNSGPRITPVPS
ncbi:hypothetical protein NL676_023035 [Syzygium grande]|nr:hypothetical protein NL676_023035 [Syzygium grande]